MINLELYKIFVIVGNELNITKASEKLNISQPAITKHIKNLEENENSEKQKVANFKKQYQQRNEAYEKTIEDTIQMYHEKEQQER